MVFRMCYLKSGVLYFFMVFISFLSSQIQIINNFSKKKNNKKLTNQLIMVL